MESQDFYAILGVGKEADNATIRQAFKRLALTHHPDKVGEADRHQAEIRFKVISEAYEVLSNEESRMLYDAQCQFAGSSEWQDFYAGPQEDFFGFGSSQFERRFATHSKTRTEDAVFEIELSLEDVYKGRMLKLNSQRQVLCRRCQGSGGKRNCSKRTCNACRGSGTTRRTQLVGPGIVATTTVVCPVCHGQGKGFRDKDLCCRCKGRCTQEIKTLIEVYIPKGVKNRHRIVIEGHSDEEPGKVAGDLVILVLVNSEHHTFRREGCDLYATSEVSLKEALTGFSRPLITHLDGRSLKPTVARGSILRPGCIMRIPGEGMIIEDISTGSQTTGDLYIQTSVVFPDSIDEHVLDKLAMLLAANDDDDSEGSDDTLSEQFRSTRKRAGKAHNSEVDVGESQEVEHEIVDDASLPEYLDDPNDEPEPASNTSRPKTARENTRMHGFVPGCTTV